MREIDSPAHLGSGRGEGAGRRGPAAAALMERGGDARGAREALVVAAGHAGLRSHAELLL